MIPAACFVPGCVELVLCAGASSLRLGLLIKALSLRMHAVPGHGRRTAPMLKQVLRFLDQRGQVQMSSLMLQEHGVHI